MSPDKDKEQEKIIETSQQKTASFVLRIVGQFLIFLLVLIGIGILLNTKINDSLNQEVAKFGAHQGQLVSTVYNNLLQGEIKQLEDEGRLITLGQMPAQEVAKVLGGNLGNAGLLDINGAVVSGRPLPEEASFQRVKAIQGSSSVAYYEHLGMVTMVPVYEGMNIRYVLYRLHTEKELSHPSSLFQFSDQQEISDKKRAIAKLEAAMETMEGYERETFVPSLERLKKELAEMEGGND